MSAMDLSTLHERTQDYLKTLWGFEERNGLGATMSLGDLAKATDQKLPTTSEAVKRLAAKGLVEHERYLGVRLTEEGRGLAVIMARRHRLLETFLMQTLNYSWDELHEEADMLEHALSDRFVARIDELLGYPTRDPHGDPIPGADGSSEPLSRLLLGDVAPGVPVIMEQVNDSDPEFLRYLDSKGVRPGVELQIVSAPVAGLLEVSINGGADKGGAVFSIGQSAAGDITVREKTED